MDQSKRRPGRPALIDQHMIVTAALELDASGTALSMQAVADRLGVPRGTLYHHVADREEMVALVAAARLEEALDEAWMPADDADWRTWLTAFAHVMRDALLARANPIGYVLLDGAPGSRQLAQVERILHVMVRDGFTPQAGLRCLAVLAEIVQANVRAVVLRRAQGPTPAGSYLHLVRAAPEGTFPLLRAADGEQVGLDDQFAFALDVMLTGFAAHAADGR
ncbi:TetR/AcrR family transcriptional regulator [Yinghuangia soli]|uniref:TetR/AcrR family transcriptional regulator C-terminal domain-containing protein n=1 Tax=Yinghuangia soli TaxID=2908204 RepID=A0AA41U5Y5_9ACTN|nr:TetR/AcrR family transcriptional regulator C-terminal domain-containing protein [Yinghuangia soli]MCF2532382.1 TetR/AcrR family transcriptional regulator C-terminal domain-containing protein [Yinghuangia soli]